jgi:hypothetical protein
MAGGPVAGGWTAMKAASVAGRAGAEAWSGATGGNAATVAGAGGGVAAWSASA